MLGTSRLRLGPGVNPKWETNKLFLVSLVGYQRNESKTELVISFSYALMYHFDIEHYSVFIHDN